MGEDYNQRRKELYEKNKEHVCALKRAARKRRLKEALAYEKQWRLKQKNKTFVCSTCKKEKNGKKVKNMCHSCYNKKKYHEMDDERKKERNKKHNRWCERNRQQSRNLVKKSDRKRRAKLLEVNEVYTNKEWLNKLNKTQGICPGCKKQKGIWNLHLDHILPISKAPKGFVYTINDVQPLCKSCNSKKGNKITIKNYTKEDN